MPSFRRWEKSFKIIPRQGGQSREENAIHGIPNDWRTSFEQAELWHWCPVLRNASFPPTPPWRTVATGSWGTSPFNSLPSEQLWSEWGSCSHRAGREGEIPLRNTDQVLIMLGKYQKGLGAFWCPCTGWHWTAQTNIQRVYKAPLKTYQFPVWNLLSTGVTFC